MKTVVITGAASGLGKAIAHYYAKQNCHIIVADIQDEMGNEVVDAINSEGGSAIYFHCDISAAINFQALAAFTESTTGRCDILVNNAGVASAGTLMESTEEEWDRLITLDLMSCIRGSKAFIPLIKKTASAENPCAIVSTASYAGVALMPGMMSYNVTKAGVIAFTESLRLELIKDHIHVAAACPAFFKTNLLSSMVDANPATVTRVAGWMEKSKLTADMVAEDIAKGIEQKLTLIFCDAHSKKLYKRIRWFYYTFISKRLRLFG